MKETIRVACVFPDGRVDVYGPQDADTQIRPFLESKQFVNYGNAVLWAQEFEDIQLARKGTR